MSNVVVFLCFRLLHRSWLVAVTMYVSISFLLPWVAAMSVLVNGMDGEISSSDMNSTMKVSSSPPTPGPLSPTTSSPQTTTTTTSASMTTTSLPSNTLRPNCPNYDWTVPSDTIIILDISESFGKSKFEEAAQFFRDLLASTAVLRPDKTRIAVLTFADHSRTLMDFISGNSDLKSQLPECELFAPGGLWDTKVVWERCNGEKLKGKNNFFFLMISDYEWDS